MKDISIAKELKSLPDLDHYRNLLKILHYDDFWDDSETMFYLRMYVEWIIKKMDYDNLPSHFLNRKEKLFDAVTSFYDGN